MTELDAKVAKKVMGLSHDDVYLRMRPRGDNLNYTSEANADYEVLQHVRETWAKEELNRMGKYLSLIWLDRTGPDLLSMTYQPGDYARAALKVVGET